jgi:peroxiredoxin
MQELGELQQHAAEFKQHGVRLVALSTDTQEDTAKTQTKFPELTVLGDPERKAITAFQSVHTGAGPHGTDVAAPTTFLIDSTGKLRWVFRPERIFTRLTPEELLAAVDKNLPK